MPRKIGKAIKAGRSARQPFDQVGIVGYIDELGEQDKCTQSSFLALQLFKFACDCPVEINAFIIKDLLDLAQTETIFSKR